MIGETLGNYRVVDRLGEGGMGEVYVAEHALLGRQAAVKVLLPNLSTSKEVVERFFNEARAATRIKHSGIIDIFDFGFTESGSAYIVMDLLDGESLEDRLARMGRLPEEDALHLGRQIASALDAAHRAGIIHRDLKPDNVFIIPDTEMPRGERIKILDFGIAKLTLVDEEGVSKTRTGAIMGSPLYMAPEQCRGAAQADARADIYALGCVLYHMACGRPPFDGYGAGDVIAKHIYEDPAPPRALIPGLSDDLESLILQCLVKAPAERFPSMATVVTRIDAAAHDAGYSSAKATPTTGTPVADSAAPAGGSIGPAVPPAEHGSTGHPLHRTTLSSAVSESVGAVDASGPGRRRKKIALGSAMAAAAVIAAVVGSTRMLEDGEQKPVAARAAAPSEDRPLETVGEVSPPLAAQDAETESETRSDEVTFEITSDPKALVRRAEGKALGETPVTIDAEKGSGAERFVLTRAGYEDAEVKLVADRDRTEHVELRVREPENLDSARRTRKRPREGEKRPGGEDAAAREVTASDPAPEPTGGPRFDELDTEFGKTSDPFRE